MHIADGVLSAPVLAVGAAAAAAGVGYGLWKMDYDRVPRVAVMSSAFFVASLIHVPTGPTSVHPVLIGLIGLVLGWAAFPALLVALLLQAILFQHGGITTLGVNVANMALPAVISYGLFSRLVRNRNRVVAVAAAFAAGAFPIALAYLFVSVCLWTTGEEFAGVILLGLGPHLLLTVIEGALTVSAVSFLRKVRPELLTAPRRETNHG